MTTGYVSLPAGLEHDTGAGHPECPARLVAVQRALDECGVAAELARESAPAALPAALERVHPAGHIAHIEERVAAGAPWVDSPDANVSRGSYATALAACGGALLACDQVASGAWSNAFVAVRPPGHHAEESLAMGFCLFNNVAVAARHVQAQHGALRVAILDWDVHHGNGTQHLFEEDPSVFYASLHQFPHYPGSGAERERGHGDGEGTTLNCPQPAGSGDVEWLGALEQRILPALEAFDPDWLLISAGFDAHERDPLSSTRVSTGAFRTMTRLALDFARGRCGGRVVSVLEGGYDLEGLAASARVHVEELAS